MHIPERRLYENSEKIAFFIHGFMGSPDQFKELMDIFVKNGFSVVSTLLPGHGNSETDFLKVTLDDWETHIKNEILLLQNYGKIYLIGHSIGGLLALNLSMEIDVAGVIAISTPLKIYLFNLKAYWRRIKFMCLKKDSEIKKVYKDAMSIRKPNFYKIPLLLKVMFQPHKLMRKTAKNLKQISVPTLMFHSKNDETVVLKSSKLFKEGLTNSCHQNIVLNDSFHAYYTKDEWKLVVNSILKYIHNY